MNLILHGIGKPHGDNPIEVKDALLADPGRRYSVVLSNPPFGRKSSLTRARQSQPRHHLAPRRFPGRPRQPTGTRNHRPRNRRGSHRRLLPLKVNSHHDVDRACELLGQAIPSLGSLHSTRRLERFNTVRRALAAHATRPSVQEFENRYRTTVMAAGTRA